MKFEELSRQAQAGIEKFRKFISSLDDSKYEFFDGRNCNLNSSEYYGKYSDIKFKDQNNYPQVIVDIPGILATFLLIEGISSSKEILDIMVLAKDKNYWINK